MKVNMNNYSTEEIISHLEIYGDENDGNIIRVLQAMKDERDCALDDVREYESSNDDDEFYKLQDENEELHDKLKEIAEIAKGE